MILGVGSDLRHPPAQRLNHSSQLSIGYAGGWRTPREWEAVFSALSACDWQIAGREVVVRMLSNHATLRGGGKRHVEFLGWRSVEETVNIMSQTDVGYVPYWFDERYGLSVRLCFPGKVTTYLAAGRPILYHGPEDSSVVDFLERFPAGLGCHSMDEDDIVEALRRLIVDQEFYARAAQAGQAALNREFSARIFRRRFAGLMNVEESELRPMDAESETGSSGRSSQRVF
jgi:glycosyltransferase involved in cell wall biosynthesis